MRIICRTILPVALAAANCALGANAFPEARGVLVRFAGEAVAEKFAFDRMYAAEPQAEVLAKDGKILVRATDENRAVSGDGSLDRWLADYAERRYGIRDRRIEQALSLLARSVWNVNRCQEGCSETVFCARPKWNVAKSSTWASDKPLYYNPKDVESAARLYLGTARKKRRGQTPRNADFSGHLRSQPHRNAKCGSAK